nr:hypothetical protein [Comamonas jiangduensis]
MTHPRHRQRGAQSLDQREQKPSAQGAASHPPPRQQAEQWVQASK